MSLIVTGQEKFWRKSHARSHEPWLRHDMEEARQVQQRLFPQEIPQVTGWDLAAACRPARLVSGDYYDLFELGPERLVIAIGDVSGKGLGPALVMAGLRALIRSRLPQKTNDLAELMRELNDYLLATTPDAMFVTLFLAVLDLSTGRLSYANAGHIPPLVLANPFAEGPMRFTSGGPVLGIIPDALFEEGEVGLKQGSVLALFTDGIPEECNAYGRMFNQRRVVDSLRRAWGKSLIEMLADLLGAVERFRGKGEQADDIAVVLLQRLID